MQGLNTSILQTISQGIQKGKALAPTAKIYLYGGHGGDVCNKDTKEVLIDTVPDDCIYVTIGVCGRSVISKANLYQIFASKDEKDKKLIRDLFQSDKSLEEFAKKIDISPENLHIHYPGMKYVVNNFSPVSIHDSKKGTVTRPEGKRATLLRTSGLIDKTKYEEVPEENNYSFILEEFLDTLRNSRDFVMQENALVYLKAVYRKFPHIVKLLDSKRAKKALDAIQVPVNKKFFLAKRLLPVMEAIMYRYDKETVLEKYDASVFPTKEEVSALLDGQTFSSKDLQELTDTLVAGKNATSKYSYAHNSSSAFTNTNLMKRFPGIHFNFTCRNTSNECEAHTEMRRQESEQTSSVVKTQLTNKQNTLGDDYEYVIEWMQEIVDRNYKDIQARRVAMFNSLKSIKHILSKLSPYEKEEVIKFLFATKEQILIEDISKRTLIQKKILHLIFPEKYSLQGGTRKRKHTKRNKSRKF